MQLFSNVLIKADKIKYLIEDTVNEMKDMILASVSKRHDILEVYAKTVENQIMKK